MKIRSLSVAMILALACATVASCAQRPTKETTDAVAALQKIQAGTQVGINYQQYGQLLIDAKAKVNDAMRSLPDGPLKTEINGAMDSYSDAATVWGVKINGRSLYDSPEPDKSLIAKYHIPVTPSKYAGGPATASPDDALQIIWLRANIHLNQIDTLLKQSGK